MAASCSGEGPRSSEAALSGDLAATAETASDAADADADEPTMEQSETSDETGSVIDPAGDTTGSYEPAVDLAHLPADPATRLGVLDNGLTYYLRSNNNPGNNLDLRLIVRVGSVNETDTGAGIAHFVEHMLFNGTTSYPGNSLGTAMWQIGVELGPDLNAHVSYDETVFEMSVNTTPATNVSAVFRALSQMAYAATFDPGAVISERGVVLDEMRRRRETSDGYVTAEFDRVYTQGTPYEGRDPLGTIASVEAMTADDLRTFYETWYVASNMAVVAVGDLGVEDLENLVAEYFGPMPAGEAPTFEPVVAVPNPEPSTHVVTDAGQGFSYISMDIPIAPHNVGTVGGERLNTMEQMIEVTILNRLTDAYHRGELSQVDPPSFVTFDHTRALRYYGTNWQGPDLASASTDYLNVLLTAYEHGFTPSETQRAVEQLAAGLEFQLQNASTTQDYQHAQRYENHFLRGADLGAVQDRVDRVSALLEELTSEELTAHYRRMMDRAGPMVVVVGPNPACVPTTDDLDAALAAAAAGPQPMPVAEVDQLMDIPEPVDALTSGPMELLDGHEWEFANGARVMFVPSDIAEGVVNIEVRSLGGWSLLEPGSRALAPWAFEAVLNSGSRDLTKAQINRFLENSTVSLGAYIDETAEGFYGGAAPEDLETLFQLMYLRVTSPQIDDTAFGDAVNETEIRASLAEVNSQWQAWVAYNEARFGETWHRPVATREQVAAMNPDDLLAMYKHRMSRVDDMIVAVVGDIDAAEVGRLARHYIGSLPAGSSDTFADRRPPMPEELVRRDVNVADGESAVLEIYYETPAEVTPSSVVAADVLETALSQRLFLTIHEQLGASYTATAWIDPMFAPVVGYDARVYVTLDPDRFDEVHSAVLGIVDDIAANGVTPAEYAQAVAVVTANYNKTSNADLLGVLVARLLVADNELITPQRRLAELDELTLGEVQALAAAIYGGGGRVEVASKQ